MMIPYHGYEAPTALPHTSYTGHHHHPAQETPEPVPKYTRLLFKLPRIVPDQREKFDCEDIFKKHSREAEVRYTLYRDRPAHERQAKFQSGCRDGHTEISFSGSGLVLVLHWVAGEQGHSLNEFSNPSNGSYCDFTKERGKVHICSSFILNGVCVRWRGWLDLERLDGVGSLELDTELAAREEALLQRQLALVQQKVRECEEIYRGDLQMKKLPSYT